jgi:hypothetical protein
MRTTMENRPDDDDDDDDDDDEEVGGLWQPAELTRTPTVFV